MVQWFHQYEMTDETFALILRTFCSQFGGVLLWEIPPSKGDVLLIGSAQPLSVDFARAQSEMNLPEVAKELSELGIKTLPTALSLQTGGNAAARALAGTGRINEDQFPVLEYEAPKALFSRSISDALYSQDQRQTRRGLETMLLTEYLRGRGKPLTPKEFENLVEFHSRTHGMMAVPFLREWIRRYPDDQKAAWALSDVKMDAGDADGALSIVEELLRRSPKNPEYLERAASLSFDQFLGYRSYLTQGSPDKSLGFWKRLAEAAGGDKRTLAYQKIAEILANAGALDEAERYVEIAAAGARAGADRIWITGARMALDRGRRNLAAAYLDKALKLNPGNSTARSMRSNLP
jgi:tetratricopeptide (TPR) repeat protein